MKYSLAALLLSLSLSSFGATFTATVDEAWCGEVSPMVIGDACILQVTKTNGVKLGLVFDFDDFTNLYGEMELTGAKVKINDEYLSKITDYNAISELRQFSGHYFYMYSDIDALIVRAPQR